MQIATLRPETADTQLLTYPTITAPTIILIRIQVIYSNSNFVIKFCLVCKDVLEAAFVTSVLEVVECGFAT